MPEAALPALQEPFPNGRYIRRSPVAVSALGRGDHSREGPFARPSPVSPYLCNLTIGQLSNGERA